jgi:hypothetical protein
MTGASVTFPRARVSEVGERGADTRFFATPTPCGPVSTCPYLAVIWALLWPNRPGCSRSAIGTSWSSQSFYATMSSSAGSCRISVPWRPTPASARHGAPDSMAVWYLENQGPNFASCEYFRRQAGVPLQNYCVAVDFGQSVDNSVVQRVILRVYKKGSNDQYLHNFDVLPSSDMLVFWYLLFGI